MDGLPEYQVARPRELPSPAAVAIHCSEGRFAPAFDELLARVGSPEAEHIAVPGGPWWLAQAGRFSMNGIARLAARRHTASFEQAISRQLLEAGIRRVILLGHQDCAWYARLQGLASTAHADDLVRARDALARVASPAVVINGYVLTVDESGARFRTVL